MKPTGPSAGQTCLAIFISLNLSVPLLLAACSAPLLRIESDFVPPKSLRLAQVVEIAKRDEIIEATPLYDALIAAGIKDSDIVDRTVVFARIYCCGGPTRETSSEVANATMAYVPRSITVELGDIVEYAVADPSRKGTSGALNVVTRLIQKKDATDGHCWWDPKDDRLWLRVLYCDWMPGEGWIRQGGLHPAWFRPSTSAGVDK